MPENQESDSNQPPPSIPKITDKNGSEGYLFFALQIMHAPDCHFFKKAGVTLIGRVG